MTRTVSPSPEQLGELIAGLREEAALEAKFSSVILDCRNSRRWQAADALESTQAEIARLTTALTDARGAIASLDTDALGMGTIGFGTPGVDVYPIRDELLATIDAALKDSPNVG
jgi:hypothetical protein